MHVKSPMQSACSQEFTDRQDNSCVGGDRKTNLSLEVGLEGTSSGVGMSCVGGWGGGGAEPGMSEAGSWTGSVASSSATGLSWAWSPSDPGNTFHMDQAVEEREWERGRGREGWGERERRERPREEFREARRERDRSLSLIMPCLGAQEQD